MANHKSAEKRNRQTLKRAERNNQIRRTVRSAVRSARLAATQGADDAPAKFQNAERLLRKATSKGAYHPKTTSRTISRLAKLL